MSQPFTLTAAVSSDFEKLCRAHGMPMTVQRRAVLAALYQRRDHPTADEIFAGLQTALPGISRPTVYRVLDSLVKIGIAKKVSHPGAAARFETRLHRHHHLVCVRCDKVVDFDHPAFDALALPDARTVGFECRDYSIHFQGVCAACAKADRRAPRTKAPPRRKTAKRGG